MIVARKINRMKLPAAKRFLEDMLKERKSIRVKFYTKTVEQILKLLKSAENNALNKGLELEKLKINISVHKGPIRHRTRRKRAFGTRLKMTNMQVILQQPISKKRRQEVQEPAGGADGNRETVR